MLFATCMTWQALVACITCPPSSVLFLSLVHFCSTISFQWLLLACKQCKISHACMQVQEGRLIEVQMPPGP